MRGLGVHFVRGEDLWICDSPEREREREREGGGGGGGGGVLPPNSGWKRISILSLGG